MRYSGSAIAIAALSLALASCGPKAERAADAVKNDAGAMIGKAEVTASNAAEDVKAAVTPTPTAQEFSDTAAKSDAFEIAAAKLALTNAASADVKSFADEMLKAHANSTAKLKAAAREASPVVTPDATFSSIQNDELAALGRLKGAEFDEEYIDGQVDAHQNALTLMQAYAKDGEAPSLKIAAGEIAPIVSRHLEMARALHK